MTDANKPKRPYETRYFAGINQTKRTISRGFPKAEDGSINGAAREVAKGRARKVQCIDREDGHTLWTIVAKPKVRGVNIIPYDVIPGDDNKPSRRKESK